MKPLFAVTAGITAYFVWLTIDQLVRFDFAHPKALLGGFVGAVVFGSYAFAEFRRMTAATESKFEEERKWVENAVRPGMSVKDAADVLGGRFEAKESTTGLSFASGLTKVQDFSSDTTEVRLISKRNAILSVRVVVPRAPKA